MGLEIAKNSLQETCLILVIVGVSLAIAATALRFVATRRTNRKPSWEDWSSVLATFFFILYAIPLLYLLSVMNGQDLKLLTEGEVIKIKKAGYSMGPQFCMQQLFAKLSILFLYYRIFHVNRKFVYCIYFLGLIQLLWSIATYLAHFLECTPPRKLWDPTVSGHCINSQVFLAAGETPNSLVDFALIGLAIWMVQSLKMKRSLKIKLVAVFMIGGLAGILGFVKISEGFGASKASKVELLDPIWATVQQTCSVICCCAPIYKPLIPEVGFFQKIQSLGTRVFSRSRNTESGAQIPSEEMGANGISVRRNWKDSNHWVQLDDHLNNTQQTDWSQIHTQC